MPRTVKCFSHGKVPWEGHMVCDACKRIYMTQGPKADAPEKVCACGEVFRPGGPDSEFTARIICGICATATQ